MLFTINMHELCSYFSENNFILQILNIILYEYVCNNKNVSTQQWLTLSVQI